MIRKFKIINVEFLIIHSSKNTVKNLVKEDCRLVNLGILQWLDISLLGLFAREEKIIRENSSIYLDLVKKQNANRR